MKAFIYGYFSGQVKWKQEYHPTCFVKPLYGLINKDCLEAKGFVLLSLFIYFCIVGICTVFIRVRKLVNLLSCGLAIVHGNCSPCLGLLSVRPSNKWQRDQLALVSLCHLVLVSVIKKNVKCKRKAQ